MSNAVITPSNRFVSEGTFDRQWDCRFNVQLDEDLGNLVEAIREHWEQGKLNYILIGGVEIGELPFADDFGIKHVHVAAIFKERITKRSILNHWRIKRGNGYYLVPWNRALPYAGWRTHHTKPLTKVPGENEFSMKWGLCLTTNKSPSSRIGWGLLLE